MRDGAGHLRAVDWYDLSSPGWVSSTMGAALNLSGEISKDPAVQESIARFRTANQKGDLHAGAAALAALPPPLGESLMILNLRAQISLVAKEPDEARRAMALMAGKYPTEPAAAHQLYGFYRDTQQYDKALRALDVVEQSIGVDGTTSINRATIYHYLGDDRQAAKVLEKATRLEPDSSLVYRVLAGEYLAIKDSPRTTATLDTLRTRFGISMTVKELEDQQGKDDPAMQILRKRWTATK